MLNEKDHQRPATPPRPDSLIRFDKGKEYWEGVDADLNGMLGGVSHVSKADLQGSCNFLAKLGIGVKDGQRRVGAALEGGAGIGRITRGLLVDVAERVDVVEPVAKFTEGLRGHKGVGQILNMGLQDWAPAAVGRQTYDLVWNQWCLGHLTDEQLVGYLGRCKAALNPDGGVLVVKENLSTSGRDLFDVTDSSVTREDKKFRSIFEQAGLRVVRSEQQRGFPKELFPVKMYALQPQKQPGV